MQTTRRSYEEKRRAIRMHINAPAMLTLEDGSCHNVTCVDLSSDGVQIETHEKPQEGMLAELLLEPGGGPITPLNATIKVCRIIEMAPETFRAGATIETIE